MSRIQNAFAKGKAFIGFVTGGDPSIEKSEEFVLSMIRAGADLIEIGIPFSDPIAEGPVIQRANIRALSAKAGSTGPATVGKIFALAERLRTKTDVPLVFLTYFNPVFRYGCGAFFRRCREAGVDGIIIPDLPFEEQEEVRDAADACGVDLISLIAPTSKERIARIAAGARGFIYIVSSMGVTGIRARIETDLAAIIAAARPQAKVPLAVGFGVSTPSQAAEIARLADGVIVGSAIVKIIEEYGEQAGPRLYDYVKTMKEAAKGEAAKGEAAKGEAAKGG